MLQRTRSLLALESSSFTLLNFFPPVSGQYNLDGHHDDGDGDDVDGGDVNVDEDFYNTDG